MSGPKQEETLHGGNVTSVVRVGATVRRTASASTPTVHRLLAHVRARGITWVPEPLGFDELGREILSFLPGEVPHDMPDWVWSEVVLTDAARALGQWHQATADFDCSSAVWGMPATEPHEVICHNDFAPYNCVFRDGRWVGAIDFDLCSPGPRLWDFAYTAYRFVPLMPPRDADVSAGLGERSPFSWADALGRLDAFLDAYGAACHSARLERAAVIATTVDRLRAIATWTENHVRTTGATALEHHAAMYRAHAGWLSTRVSRGI